MSMQKSVRVKSFELSAQDIADVDVELLHALSTGVGWPHRAADWDFLRSVGQGIAAIDGIGRVFGSAMWFPHGSDFATIGLVITTPRAQANGTGRWMMEQVMRRCAGRDLSLNSTKAAYPLYLSLGFVKEATVSKWQGTGGLHREGLRSPASEAAEMSEALLGEIAELDAPAFGAHRGRLLAALADGAKLRVLRRGGAVVGYAMCRKFGPGDVIGPIVAATDEDAVDLVAPLLGGLPGSIVRVDTREARGPFIELLKRSGLVVTETVTTMSKGRKVLNRSPGAPWVYGLAGHALS
jgi:GNAT superfamily N-acetyltransferase